MRSVIAFLLLTASVLAQCGPGGCPPQWGGGYQQGGYQQGGCPGGNCPPRSWGGGVGIGLGGGYRQSPRQQPQSWDVGVGIGIGGHLPQQQPRFQPKYDPRTVIRIGDDQGYFSGVMVGGNYVLTAKHCLGGGQPRLFAEIGGRRVGLEYVQISNNSEGPVILFAAGGPYPSASVAASPEPANTCVCGVGYRSGESSQSTIIGRCNGGGWMICEGRGNVDCDPGTPGAWRCNIVSAPAFGGQSGGPLFNSRGELIGLLSSSDHQTSSEWISWAVTKAAAEFAINSRRRGGGGQGPVQWGNPAPEYTPQEPEPEWGEPAEQPPSIIPPRPTPRPIQEQPRDDSEIRQELAELKAMILNITVNSQPGPAGKDGPPGRDGVDGKDGLPGKNGLQGLQGPAGRNGKDGVDGKDADPRTMEAMQVLLAQAIADVKRLKERQPDATIDPNDIAELRAEIERMKATKIPVQILTQDGKLFDEAEYTLGSPIKLKLSPK